MTTGSQEERLAVNLNSIPFAIPVGGTLEGPATYRPRTSGLHGDPGLPPPECSRHHFYNPGAGYPPSVIDLPPQSTSVLVAKYRLVGAPWAHTDLRMRYSFLADSSSSSDPSASLTFKSPDLFSPRPVLAGVRGVPLTLATLPGYKTTTFPEGPLPHISLGKSVVVRGRTDPAVAGDRIIIRATLWPNGPHPFTIGRPRVDAHGHFAMRWRPRHRQTYGIYAVYRSQHPSFSDESTPCNLPILVR